MEHNEYSESNWDKATWYIAPEEEPAELYQLVKDDVSVCAHSLPFTTEAALNAGYVLTGDEGSYMAMANSAILCTHPEDWNAYYVNEMVDEDY